MYNINDAIGSKKMVVYNIVIRSRKGEESLQGWIRENVNVGEMESQHLEPKAIR